MTRIALIAMLFPIFAYSTEAVSAPVFYRSQSASSNRNPIRQTISEGTAPTRVRAVSESNTPQRQTPASASSLTPLGYDVFPQVTFLPYRGSPSDSGTNFRIETVSKPDQAPFNVTLVGVNVNAWLENPDTYKVLIEAAEQFPIPRFLDNIVHNNPEITLNNPELTSRILRMDIYAPYLSNVTKTPKLPPLFNEYRGAVAHTRNYNIYGTTAGGLPYFGTPTEGADRRINLAVNKHQFREYAVRFPDTDIFLVATINISPNWLEEGWDIRQENRQFADVFIYAFDRKGKLIGGGGISQNFLHKGQFISLIHRVYSKYWQPAIPRVFYVTPS
ncbi:MAG: hypothetical protein ACRCY4_03110, partial [Brevinema sp.]